MENEFNPMYPPNPLYAQPDYRQYGTAYGHQDGQTGGYQMMQPGQQDSGHHQRYMSDLCKRYQHYLVQCEGADNQMYDGIIEGIDDDSVYLLVPVGDMERDDLNDVNQAERYGNGYGGYSPYGYPRRFRRFRRRRFPFFFLRNLFFPPFY